MPSDQDDERVRRIVIEALREKMPDTMPVPSNRELGEHFDRRMTAARSGGGDREVYSFPAHIRDLFDGLDKEDVDALKLAVKLTPAQLKWVAGKSETYLATIDQMAKDYEKAAIIGWFLKWAVIGLAGIFAGSWALGEKVSAILTYFRIGRLP